MLRIMVGEQPINLTKGAVFRQKLETLIANRNATR